MQEKKQKPQIPVPLILVGVIIIGTIGYSLFNKFSDSFSQTTTTVNTQSNNVSGVNFNQTNGTKNSNLSAENTNTAVNITNTTSNTENTAVANSNVESPSPTVDQDKARQMGQKLKRVLDDFIKDQQDEYTSAGKEKSFYEDIDNDGLEDAAFTYSVYPKGSNNFYIGLVVFRNDGESYNFVGKEEIAGKYGFHIENITVKKGSIVIKGKEPAENDPACCPSIPKTLVFVIKDNRLQLQKGRGAGGGR